MIKVCQQTHLGRASVYSYLPFKNDAYGLDEKSAAAIRQSAALREIRLAGNF